MPPDERVSVEPLGHDLFNVRVQYGFMEDPDVPAALVQAREQGLPLDLDDLTYFLGRETIIVTRRKGMAIWREKLFVLMARNAVRATAFFRLPPERVVELGRAGRDVAVMTETNASRSDIDILSLSTIRVCASEYSHSS